MSLEPTIETIRISDRLTGETNESTEFQGDAFSDFAWREGNFACDCNRYLFFMRAKGVEVDLDEDDYPCDHGEPRFRICIQDAAGEILFDDTSVPAT